MMHVFIFCSDIGQCSGGTSQIPKIRMLFDASVPLDYVLC
jgi:hypothetical protein